MKSIIILIAALLTYNVSAQDTLTILHVNDTHSMLAPVGPRTPDLKGTRGGIARAASVIGSAKMTETNVLTLHGGDIFIGDLFFNVYFGAAEMQIMNSLGFDAMTLGNHEFDLQPSTLFGALDAALKEGGFEVLSANTILEDPEVQPLKNYVKPYTIRTYGSIKAGIFGLTTPSANYFSLPAPAVIDTSLAQITVQMITALSNEGCNFIIMLSHLGSNLDNLIAADIPGINIIIGAHDHFVFEESRVVYNPAGLPTYILQAGSAYSHVGQAKVIFENGAFNVTSSLIPLDENIPEESSTAALVDTLIAGIEAKYGQHFFSEQVAYAAGTFNEIADPFNGRDHSTDVGNLVTDAFRDYSGTDVAITVGGSTSQPLYQGPIVAADVFRMIGYGFNEINGLGYRLTTFRLKGADLTGALQACLSMTQLDDELLPQVSGMRYSYNTVQGMLVLDSVFIGDNPIDPNSDYSVTTNEFLSYALQNLFGIPVQDLKLDSLTTEFQCCLEYILKQGGTITPVHQQRVTPVSEDIPGVPEGFNLKQNYPNPFNPSTNIEFSIPEKMRVILKMFDFLGREAAILVEGELNAGTHKITWNAEKFASGVYFYQIRAGNITITRKMNLIK